MFCKKCDKKIFDIIKSNFEYKNRCKCGNAPFFPAEEETEIIGLKNGFNVFSKINPNRKKK